MAARIKLNFGLNVDGSIKLFKNDIDNLEGKLIEKKIAVKIPVAINPESLKNIEKTIKEALSNIKPEGLDLSESLKNAKVNLGVDASSLKDLGVKIDVLTGAINNLTNALGGQASSAQVVSGVAQQAVSDINAMANSISNIGGLKGVKESGGRRYIGAERGTGVEEVYVEQIIDGSDVVSKGAFGNQITRTIDEKIDRRLDSEGFLSVEQAADIKDTIVDIVAETYMELAETASAGGKKHVYVPSDEQLTEIAKGYMGRVDAKIKPPAPTAVPTYDISDSELTAREEFKSFWKDYEKDFGPNQLGKAYEKFAKIISEAEGKTVAPLTEKVKNSLLGVVNEADAKREELRDKTEAIEQEKQKEAERQNELAKELTSEKTAEVTAVSNTVKAEEETAKLIGASDEDLRKIAIGQLKDEGFFEEAKDKRHETTELLKKSMSEKDAEEAAKANQKADEEEAINNRVLQLKEKQASAIEAETQATEKHASATQEQTKDFVVMTDAAAEHLNSQVANENMSEEEKKKKNEEYIEAEKKVTEAFNKQAETINSATEAIEETSEEATKASTDTPKAKLSQKSIDAAKDIETLFGRLVSARASGDIQKGDITYQSLTKAISSAGEQTLKAFYGSDYAAFRTQAKADGAKGSAEIRAAAQQAARDELTTRLGRMISYDSEGNVSFVKTAAEKAMDAISRLEEQYSKVIGSEEKQELQKLRYQAGTGIWTNKDQASLESVSNKLIAASMEMEKQEQRASDEEIRQAKTITDIAKDTSLDITEQFARALELVGQDTQGNVYDDVRKYGVSSEVTQQVARALGLEIQKDGSLKELENRAQLIEGYAGMQDYWRKKIYPSLSADYSSASGWTSGGYSYEALSGGDMARPEHYGPKLLSKEEIERQATILSEEQTKAIKNARKIGKSQEEIQALQQQFVSENKKVLEESNRQAFSNSDTKVYHGGYNEIMDNPDSPLYGILNYVSRSRFGYPVIGGYDKSENYMPDTNLLRQQADSLRAEVEVVVDDLASALERGSERWKQLGSNEEGYQNLWRALSKEGEGDDGASVIRSIIQDKMLGIIDDDTAIRMFDLNQNRVGLEQIDTARKMLLDMGVSQERLDSINNSALATLGSQASTLQQLGDLADKYGLEWEYVLDPLKSADGELQNLIASFNVLSKEGDPAGPIDKFMKEAKSVGSRNVKITQGSKTDTDDNSIVIAGKHAETFKKVAAAATDAANAEDKAEKETKEAGDAAQKASAEWGKYSGDLDDIYDKYHSLIDLSPDLKRVFRSLSAKDLRGTLKTEELESYVKLLDDINTKGIASDYLESDAGQALAYGVNSTINKLKQAGVETRDLETEWKNLQNTIKTEGASYDSLGQFIHALKEAEDELNKFRTEALSALKLRQTEQGFASLGQKIQIFGEKYKNSLRIDPELGKAFSELQDNFNNFNNEAGRTPQNLQALSSTLGHLRQQVEANLSPLQKLGIKIKSVLGERLMFMASTALISQVFGQFRNLYSAVSEVDVAMTELKKVTDLTADAYDSFLTRAASKARELGATISDYVNATADFARLGYGMSDAESLATTATVYKNVGDGIDSIGTASESIISTMKAFGIEAKNSMDIVDAFNEVGNNFAISSTGIGEALQRSASALSAANNDLDESIALVVAGNAVVQNPDTVGTALKTLSMRIRGAKTELEQAGESTEGMASSVSKLRSEVKLLTGNKVDIMLDEDTFKSSYDILRDISKVWNDISDVDQANLLELLGGKRNANVLTSILTNFEDAEEVIKTIAGDAGSAMREQEKWLDSIEGKTQQLKASGQGLAVDLINTDAVKAAVGAITKLIDGLDWLAKNAGLAASALSFFGSVKIFGNIKAAAISFYNVGRSLKTTIDSIKSSFENLRHPIKNVTESMKEAKASVVEDAVAKDADTTATYTFTGAQESEQAAVEGASEASLQDAVSKNTQSNAIKGVTSSTIGLSTALGIATLAFSAIMLVVGLVNKSLREHEQSVEDAKQRYEETEKTIDSYVEKIRQARKELNEADSEQARYEKTEELRGIQAELVDLYGDQARQLDLINGKLDTELDKVKHLSQEEAQRYYAKLSEDNILGTSSIDKALKKYDKEQYFSIGPKSDRDKIDSFLGKYSNNYSHFQNGFTLTGDINEQKHLVKELYKYVSDQRNDFDESTKESINKLYNKVIERAEEVEPVIESATNAYFNSLDSDDSDARVYKRYSHLIEEYKKAVNSNDLKQADALYGKIANLYQNGFDYLPDFARKELESMFYDAAPLKVRAQLEIIESGAATDKGLNDLLDKYKDKFGKIDINAAKKSKDWDKITAAAEKHKGSVEEVIEAINAYNGVDIKNKFEEKSSKNSLADQIDNILEAEAGFEKLQKMYWDIKDGGQFDYGSLRQKDFLETFNIEGMEDAYNSFLETVAQYPNNLAKCQEAFNNLTTEYIKQTGILDTLDEKNKTMTIAWLKNIGVANAEEIVNAKLSKSITMTADEYEVLKSSLGETVKATEKANGAFEIEEEAMKDLGVSAKDMQAIIAAVQAGMTFETIAQAKIRIATLKAEAEAYSQAYAGIKTLAEAENAGNAMYAGMVHGRADQITGNSGLSQDEMKSKLNDLKQYAKIQTAMEEAEAKIDAIATYTPPNPNKSSSGGSGKDTYLDAWKQKVKIQKDLLEQDQITEKQYYDWLRDAYKAEGGPGWAGLSAEKQKEYADEVASIQSELYKWEKDQIQKSIDEQDAILKNKYTNGLISEAEYQKQLAKVTEEGYTELKRKVDEEDLFGVDTTERLNAETELLEKIKSAHNAAYNAEMEDLEHLRTMNLITDEQYYAQHAALVQKYYAGEKMYAEEMKKEEEKLYKERIDLIKKYSSAAKEAISSIMNIGKSLADAVGNLVQNMINANSSNFDLQKKQLKHWLNMNYITEKDYYDQLEELYKKYYKSKAIYLDEYWENQEEIYQHEVSFMQDGASALENLHGKVVDMIKQELNDAKKAIEDAKDAYNELIDIRRKALEREKDNEDAEQSRIEQLTKIADLQRQVNALENDSSAQGSRKYRQKKAELIKAQREYEKFEREQAYKDAQNQLEDEQNAMELAAKHQTKAIDDYLDEDSEAIVNEAWARLKGLNSDLYDDLMEYTRKHSTAIKNDIIDSWKKANESFEEYKDNLKETYENWENRLVYPENYYGGDYAGGIGYDENGNIDPNDPRYAEMAYDSYSTERKELENWRKVIGDFAEDMGGIIGDGAQSVAKIIETLFPGPVADLFADGADMFADSLGAIGITNSMLETVALLGGTAGVLEMMRGLQDIAQGKDGSGVVIGGESIDNIQELLQRISDYQQVMIGNETITSLINGVIAALGAGPSNSSSVVTALLTMGTSLSSLLSLGTLLAGGGGAGLAGLLSAISGVGSLFNRGNEIEVDGNNKLISLLVRVCEWTGNMLDKSEANGKELTALRTILHNGWLGIYEIVSKLATSLTSSNVLSGFAGGMSALSDVFKTLLTSGSGYLPLSGESLGENFLKILANPNGLISDAITKSVKLITSTIPEINAGGNKTVEMQNLFNIEAHDPQGVADEITRLLPQIANYTLSAMVDNMGNKGVKRSAFSY